MTRCPCCGHGPLQDPINLTPFDLLVRGIEIIEAVPNSYGFRLPATDYRGAWHHTPEQAIRHARWAFKIYEDENDLQPAHAGGEARGHD